MRPLYRYSVEYSRAGRRANAFVRACDGQEARAQFKALYPGAHIDKMILLPTPRGRPPKTEPTTRDLEIVAMRLTGATWREIGIAFGLTPQRASASVSGAGLLKPAKAAKIGRSGPRGQTEPVTTARLSEIRKLLNQAGWTHRMIAEHLHVSLSTVGRARKL